MRIRFLGTRANIPIRTAEHFMHSALLVEHADGRIMIDCGADWLGCHPPAIDAILLTHAHPDHAGGLRDGAACPVYAAPATWGSFHGRVQLDRRLLLPRQLTHLSGLEVSTIPVQHSLRAPTVALRIRSGSTSWVYAPDILFFPDLEVLRGAHLYIGDGASLRRAIVRGRGERAVGHACVDEQLSWCSSQDVPRAIFTHCGQSIVRRNPLDAARLVRELGQVHGIDASIACDNDEVRLSADLP
jgi:phosphoribosyl 1,2-cyclic phosphodiesterase